MSTTRVYDHIMRSEGREVAVMVVGNRTRCVSMVYVRKVRHYIARMNAVLVGVYDSRVPEEWIEQDLLKAGVSL